MDERMDKQRSKAFHSIHSEGRLKESETGRKGDKQNIYEEVGDRWNSNKQLTNRSYLLNGHWTIDCWTHYLMTKLMNTGGLTSKWTKIGVHCSSVNEVTSNIYNFQSVAPGTIKPIVIGRVGLLPLFVQCLASGGHHQNMVPLWS